MPALSWDKKLLPVIYKTCMEKISTSWAQKGVAGSRLHVPISRLKSACAEGLTTGWCLGPDPAGQAEAFPGAGTDPHFPGGQPCCSHTRSPAHTGPGRSWLPTGAGPEQRHSGLCLFPLPQQYDHYWSPIPPQADPCLAWPPAPLCRRCWLSLCISEPFLACRFILAALAPLDGVSLQPLPTELTLVLGTSIQTASSSQEHSTEVPTLACQGASLMTCSPRLWLRYVVGWQAEPVQSLLPLLTMQVPAASFAV